MSAIITIAKRELQSFFDSLIAYIILGLFLGFSGLLTWVYGIGNSDMFFRNQADLMVFFSIAYWTLFFFIPALTMRMLAEEKKTGTIELLLTKAVTDRQVVLGKFFACISLIILALLFTLPYYITISFIGDVDHGATICGYLGLLFMSCVYIGIGLFASSITNNQIVAFLLALIIGILFHFVFGALAASFTGFFGNTLSALSMQTHFNSIARGVIDSKDLIYFISLTVLGLFLAEQVIAKRA